MRKAKSVCAGNIKIGGGAPVSIQSMTTTDTRDVSATLCQIKELEAAGADIIRLAVPDEAAAAAFSEIKKNASAPLVADIHFNYKLALMCIDGGADKIRINPGNIGNAERVRAVAKSAKAAGVPIRIGVNAGSIKPGLVDKYGSLPRAMVENAKEQAALLEDEGMSDIVISLKASDVVGTVSAYRIMAEESHYPLHLGVTEAGTLYQGIIKSSAGIGSLLLDGIGDTIRFSLTADPVEEVRAAKTLLTSLGLLKAPELVSCPTCGRCGIDLFSLAGAVEKRLMTLKSPLRVAVMGCVVNGPGEAKEADIGIAGGDGFAVLFKRGKVIKKIPEDRVLEELFLEISKMDEEYSS